MKKTFFYTAIIAVLFASCNMDEPFNKDNETATEEVATLERVYAADRNAEMLRPFAQALYKAMSESQMLREIIKTEALEKFNKEYDVLYQFIKNESVENGLTVRQLLLKHFESEEKLVSIEMRRPTLTIFVPELPEDSFSAEIWNTEEEIPAVALHITRHIHTPIFGDFGGEEVIDEFLVEAGFIPAFPVVVLRDNARVRVTQGAQPGTRSATLENNSSDFVFEFVDDYFDNSKKEEPASTRQISFNIDPKLREAFEIYENFDGWHRDYIYYGLTPANTSGTLSRDYREYITSFRFSSSHQTPEDVFNFITNHSGDPRPVTGTGSQPATQWTTGSYAFRVNAQIATASALIPTITTIFLARPDELFEITYIKEEVLTRTVFFWTTTTFFRPKVIGFKTKQLDTELMNWNLEQYAPTMKIFIAKENPGLTHTVTNTMSTEFAGNVGLDTKIGLKFGASAKITRTASVQSTIKLENRDLGNILVDFGDKVVLSRTQIPGGFLINHSTVWGFREYNNGMYAITIMPRRVQ